LSILLILLIAYLLAGYCIFRFACFRGKDTDWMNEASVKATSFGPYWDFICKARARLTEYCAHEIETTSHDGLRLKALWVPSENPKASMILFHGYRSSFLVDFSGILRLYHEQGYNVLLVHQRAHGASEGKYITFGVKERLDALTWIDFHNRTFGEIPVFLCGMSMGSSTVAFAAGESLPNNVRGITADCGFTSPYDIILHVASGMVGPWVKIMMPAVELWARLLAGFSLKECTTLQALSRSNTPFLMIHGLADTYVPSHMTQAGFDACASKKELILVAGASHGTSFLKDRPRVEKALLDFFRQNLNCEVTQ